MCNREGYKNKKLPLLFSAKNNMRSWQTCLNSWFKHLLVGSEENWHKVKIYYAQNLFKRLPAFTRLFLFDQSRSTEALLSPMAVTPKIALRLREITMATITSHMFICVWVSHQSEVQKKMSECHLSQSTVLLSLRWICACHSSGTSGLDLFLAHKNNVVLKTHRMVASHCGLLTVSVIAGRGWRVMSSHRCLWWPKKKLEQFEAKGTGCTGDVRVPYWLIVSWFLFSRV